MTTPTTLRTLAQDHGLGVEALVRALELPPGTYDLDAPLRPRVAAVYRLALEGAGDR